MSFSSFEKGKKEEKKIINDEKQNNEENPYKKIIEMNLEENNMHNNENKININKQKTELKIKKIFDKRKKYFHFIKDNYKRLEKNKTHDELNNFRDNNSKKLENFRNRNNTLNILSKYKSDLNRTFGYFDKEQIKNEIYVIKNEMKIINEELTKLKEKQNEATNKLIANKIIIEKILKTNNEKVEAEENKKEIKEEKEDKEEKEEKEMKEEKEEKEMKEEKEDSNRNEKNENKKQSFNGFYVTQMNNDTKDETKAECNNEDLPFEKHIKSYRYQDNDNAKGKNKALTCIKKKNNFEKVKFIKIKNRMKVNNFSRLVTTLKREISDYDKSIESTSKLIESKRSEGKVNIFLNMNSIIDNKNKTLGELDLQRNALSEILSNDNKRICWLSLKTKNFIQIQKKLEKFINTNQTLSLKYKSEIEKMKIEKENLINELKNLENQKNNVKKIKDQKTEERKALEEEIKNYEDLFKEKSNNEKELNDLNDKENAIKKNISKNELNINKLKIYKNSSENKIQNYSKTLKLYNDYINLNKQIKNEIFQRKKARKYQN